MIALKYNPLVHVPHKEQSEVGVWKNLYISTTILPLRSLVNVFIWYATRF